MMVVLSILAFMFTSCKKETDLVIKNNYPYRLGEYYQGGVICYIDSTFNHGLITDTIDAYGACNWSIEGDITANTSTSYNSGASNTKSIIRQESIQMEYAAYWATCNYNMSDYNDWFLPSKDELNLIFKYKKDWSWNKDQNNKTIYWSSSNESCGINVWVQDFSNGIQYIYSQLDNASVIRVRKF